MKNGGVHALKHPHISRKKPLPCSKLFHHNRPICRGPAVFSGSVPCSQATDASDTAKWAAQRKRAPPFSSPPSLNPTNRPPNGRGKPNFGLTPPSPPTREPKRTHEATQEPEEEGGAPPAAFATYLGIAQPPMLLHPTCCIAK